jgi:hypothetical protein
MHRNSVSEFSVKTAVIALGLTALVELVAHAGAIETKPGLFKTPHDAFDARRRSCGKSNWRGIVNTLSDENRDILTLAMIQLSDWLLDDIAERVNNNDAPKKAAFNRRRESLERNGVTAHLTKDVLAFLEAFEAKRKRDPKHGLDLPAVRNLIRPVMNRTDLIGEIFGMANGAGESFAELKTARIKEVTIRGDKAKGKATIEYDGAVHLVPIEFRRESGCWRIHVDFDDRETLWLWLPIYSRCGE